MVPLVAAALIGGAGALTSSLINSGSAHASNRLNRELQKYLQEDAQVFNAEQAQLNRDFQSKEAELAYERQLDYFEQTQSAQAQVRQYQEAGLNPALLAGGMSVGSSSPQSSPSGSAASSSVGSVPSSHLAQFANIIDAALSAKRQLAEIENIEANTAQTEKNTSWIDEINSTNVKEAQSVISHNEAQSKLCLQQVSESAKRISLYDNQIQVGNSTIELQGSQKVLNECQAAFTKLQSNQLEAILPYAAAVQEANLALTKAKTDSEKYSAETQMYNANLAMLDVLVKQDLISSGYYDDVKESVHWDTKYKKREYKWKPVNDICDNISKVAISAAQVIGSVVGIGGSSTPIIQTPPVQNFW